MSSPDKLDKIGAYLAERIGRDLYRHRIGFVFIAVEAMDQLLKTCHNSLHLFMESFLKVVQLVLESHDPELQILATQSVWISMKATNFQLKFLSFIQI